MRAHLRYFVVSILVACSASANQIEVENISKTQIESISEKYLELYHRIHSYEDAIAAVDNPEAEFVSKTLKLLRTVLTQVAQKKEIDIGHECYYYDLYLDVLNEKLMTSEEWSLLKGMSKHIADNCSKKRFEQEKPFKAFHIRLRVDKYSEALAGFVKFVDKNRLIQDKDTIVAVGNTPQLALESLRFSKKSLRLISVALSKWPGFAKKSSEENAGDQAASGLLTPKGLSNYQKYLSDIGLSKVAKTEEKPRLFFIDLVGSGFGLEFLIVQVVKAYLSSGQQPPEIHIISLENRENPPKGPLVGKFLKVDQISYSQYHMEDLISQVDAQEPYNFLRFTPNFPAGFWHAWLVNPRERPYYTLGAETQKAVESGLVSKGLKLNPGNQIVH